MTKFSQILLKAKNKEPRELVMVLVFGPAIILQSLYPLSPAAEKLIKDARIKQKNIEIVAQDKLTQPANNNFYKTDKSFTVLATAYSSTKDQTDDTPFTTANGKTVYEGLIAANFLPFGTRVRMPEIYGDKIFTVDDRMHKRFSNRVDVWMKTREEAIRFGLKTVKIEVLTFKK